jgi:hypothetical protein
MIFLPQLVAHSKRMRLTHVEVGQVLDDTPLGLQLHVVLVGEQTRHVAARHLLVDQQALGAAVCRERLDEQLLDARLLHLLQRDTDLLRLDAASLVHLRTERDVRLVDGYPLVQGAWGQIV